MDPMTAVVAFASRAAGGRAGLGRWPTAASCRPRCSSSSPGSCSATACSAWCHVHADDPRGRHLRRAGAVQRAVHRRHAGRPPATCARRGACPGRALLLGLPLTLVAHRRARPTSWPGCRGPSRSCSAPSSAPPTRCSPPRIVGREEVPVPAAPPAQRRERAQRRAGAAGRGRAARRRRPATDPRRAACSSSCSAAWPSASRSRGWPSASSGCSRSRRTGALRAAQRLRHRAARPRRRRRSPTPTSSSPRSPPASPWPRSARPIRDAFHQFGELVAELLKLAALLAVRRADLADVPARDPVARLRLRRPRPRRSPGPSRSPFALLGHGSTGGSGSPRPGSGRRASPRSSTGC